MAPTLVEFGSRFVVWIVGLFSMLEAVFEGLVALLEGRSGSGYAWFVGATAIFALASFAENVKAFREA